MELSDHLKLVDGVHQEMLDRLQTVKTFEPGKPFKWGDMEIMPVTVDHSAFDAYAFKIGIEGLSVFIQVTSAHMVSGARRFLV
jgi:ribonuclease J